MPSAVTSSAPPQPEPRTLDGQRPPNPGPRWWLGVRSVQLALLVAVLFVAISLFRPGFAAADNIEFLLMESVVLGIVAVGQSYVILARGIDLAVAPILGLTACVTGLAGMNDGLPILPAVGLGIGLGLVLGAVNGLLVALVRIPPIITTLGTLSLFGGLQFMYTDGQQVSWVPPDFEAFGRGQVLPLLPLPVLLLLGVAGAGWWCLRYTRFGRDVLAVGNNADAARVAGVRVRLVTGATYALSGCLAGFAGVVYVAYTGAATATTGTADNVHLQSIAAVLIGGTLISGGRGGIVSSVLAALFVTMALTGLVFLGVPAIWNSAGQGLLILAALVIERRRRGLREERL